MSVLWPARNGSHTGHARIKYRSATITPAGLRSAADTNFEIEGYRQLIDSSVLRFRSPHFGLAREWGGLPNRHTRLPAASSSRFFQCKPAQSLL